MIQRSEKKKTKCFSPESPNINGKSFDLPIIGRWKEEHRKVKSNSEKKPVANDEGLVSVSGCFHQGKKEKKPCALERLAGANREAKKQREDNRFTHTPHRMSKGDSACNLWVQEVYQDN